MKALRLITLLLLVLGIVGIFPATVFAADPTPTPTPTPTPLTIEISAPAANAKLTQKTVTVSGKVSDATAKITVQGNDATVSADGTFTTTMDLSEGANDILVEATRGQDTAYKSVSVTYVAPLVLDVSAKYPRLETTSGETAQFDVVLKLTGGEITDKPLLFDLAATTPKDWTVEITPQYPTDRKIASIQLTPGFQTGETIIVKVTPNAWLSPEPGEYPVTLAATSGNLKGSIELKAVVKAKYAISLAPENSRYNTTATAGQDNPFSFTIYNTGSAPVNDISFSSTKPDDWVIDFNPTKIDNVAGQTTQTVNVNIKPAGKAIAGDYLVTLKVAGKQATAPDMQVRVTVETPTVWGWVGVIIVVAVIGGLVFTFRQFSRR